MGALLVLALAIVAMALLVDVDDLRRQPGRLHGVLALLDVLGALGDQQHVHQLRVVLVRAHDLEVEADLVHRERDVLVGLDLDLALEVAFGKARGHLDNLGDRRVAGDRDGDVGRPGAGALDGASNRLADSLGVDDGLFVDGGRRRRFGRVGLYPVPLSALRQLDQLDRRGRDVQPQQRRRFFPEKHLDFFLLSRRVTATT